MSRLPSSEPNPQPTEHLLPLGSRIPLPFQGVDIVAKFNFPTRQRCIDGLHWGAQKMRRK